MFNKNRIGWFSDSPLGTTGYGLVTRELLNRLSKFSNYHPYAIAHNGFHQPLTNVLVEGEKRITFNILGNIMGVPYNLQMIPHYIKEYKFDLFCTLLDSFMVHKSYNQSGNYEEINFSPAKTLFYFPSDGEHFPLTCDRILRKMDYRVAMSKFGQRQVQRDHNLDSFYIPHGVNTNVFFPLPNKNQAKAMFGLLNKFVVGVVARNQPRKALDRTIKGFAEFAHGKDDVMLLLHLDPFDPAAGMDLMTEINRVQIANKVQFTGTTYFKGFSSEKLRLVYNTMDVFLLTTTGEGFGIPLIEAMACGVPVVATNYTTTPELVIDNDAGYEINLSGEPTKKLKIQSGDYVGGWQTSRGFCDIQDTADKLERLYESPEKRLNFGKNGRNAACQYYDWDTVVFPAWKRLLEEEVFT